MTLTCLLRRTLYLAVCLATFTPAAAQVITAGPPACKAIALTFDMCPVRGGPGYDMSLIDMLTQRHIPATFFLSGRWIVAHPSEVGTLLTVPFFDIGTHGQNHAHLPALEAAQQRAEILGPVTLLQKRFGRQTILFRPPYGAYDETTVAEARSLGLRLILWSAVSGDPDPSLSRAHIVQDLSWRIRDGSILVFHANGRGLHTREVVEDLVDVVHRKGLRPVTITDMLDTCVPSHDPVAVTH
jgi:peptidoglycan/xylan/chitin deacetylase (PgdA/CDA1 family)